jgi:hypothetical protein
MYTPVFSNVHLIAIPSQIYLTLATTRTTRGHDQQFQISFSRIQSHQNSYFPSAIRTWNNLSAVLISVPIKNGTRKCCKYEFNYVFRSMKNDLKNIYFHWFRIRVIVFNVTFNNISVISRRSVLLFFFKTHTSLQQSKHGITCQQC